MYKLRARYLALLLLLFAGKVCGQTPVMQLDVFLFQGARGQTVAWRADGGPLHDAIDAGGEWVDALPDTLDIDARIRFVATREIPHKDAVFLLEQLQSLAPGRVSMDLPSEDENARIEAFKQADANGRQTLVILLCDKAALAWYEPEAWPAISYDPKGESAARRLPAQYGAIRYIVKATDKAGPRVMAALMRTLNETEAADYEFQEPSEAELSRIASLMPSR